MLRPLLFSFWCRASLAHLAARNQITMNEVVLKGKKGAN